MQVHTFDKMNRHNHVRLKVLLRRVFDFAYAVYNCTNFAAGTFKRDAQYLTKNGLICPDPNNSTFCEPDSALYNAASITLIGTGSWLFVGSFTINMPLLKYGPCYRHLQQQEL